MIPKITLKKIAAEFNLSIATVSKALNRPRKSSRALLSPPL